MDSQNINLRHFFALARIADAGRLSAAAEHVHMSQSALTQALRNLEDAAGLPLFERSGFGVSATAAGEMLVRRSRRAIELLIDAERGVRAKHPKTTMSAPLHGHVTASQLRALVAIVDTGGYSTAARELGLAQPTVHRAAKELEAITGVGLFPRAARGVEPSETAKLLARFAELVFAEIRQGFEEVRELQGSTDSRIAIGCLPLVRAEFLPTAISQLLLKYPDARVSILDGPYVEQLHALRYGQIDWLIGALRDPPPGKGIVQQPLFNQPLAVVVRPNHSLITNGAKPSIRDLARLEWIAPQQLAPARQMFTALFEKNGVETPSRIIECGSMIATCRLVQQSDRAALLSPLQIRQYVETGQLAVLIDALPGTSRSIGMTVRDDWVPTRIQAAFGDVLRGLARDVIT